MRWCVVLPVVADPLLIAHRGASAECPENTLAAFQRALDLGVAGLELDVQVTRDGVPVVFHDATLLRLAGRPGHIPRLTLAALRTVRIHGEPIPTLAEVLALARGRAIVQIEIKPGVPVAPVVRAVRRTRTARSVILASFEAAAVRAAQALAPSIPRMLIAGDRAPAQPDRLLPVLARLGAGGVSLGYRSIRSPSGIAALRARGFSIWSWTVNDQRTMFRLATWGVDAVLTDHPARLQAALRSAAGGVRPAGRGSSHP